MAATHHDADWLRMRYLRDGATAQTMGGEAGVSASTIRHALSRHGIRRDGGRARPTTKKCSLYELRRRAGEYHTRGGMATSTEDATRRGAALFHGWREQMGQCGHPTEDEVVLYVSELAGTLAVSTIRHRANSILRYHARIAGAPIDLSGNLDRVLRGIARKHGRPPRKAEALLKADLFQILAALDLVHPTSAVLRARGALLIAERAQAPLSQVAVAERIDVLGSEVVVHLPQYGSSAARPVSLSSDDDPLMDVVSLVRALRSQAGDGGGRFLFAGDQDQHRSEAEVAARVRALVGERLKRSGMSDVLMDGGRIRRLERHELREVLQRLDGSWLIDRRDSALMPTMWIFGLRANAVRLVRRGDVVWDPDGSTMRFTVPRDKTDQFGVGFTRTLRGSDERELDVVTRLRDWVTVSDEQFGDAPERPLFPGLAGTNQGDSPITVAAITRALRGAAARAGISTHYSSHSMRRGVILDALRAGVPLISVSQWIGHASPETTAAYLTVGELASLGDLGLA